MNKQQEYKLNTGLAIIGITLVELVALYKGIDGLILTLVIGGLCGLGGYNLKNVLKK